jgi:hypothetical protein
MIVGLEVLGFYIAVRSKEGFFSIILHCLPAFVISGRAIIEGVSRTSQLEGQNNSTSL